MNLAKKSALILALAGSLLYTKPSINAQSKIEKEMQKRSQLEKIIENEKLDSLSLKLIEKYVHKKRKDHNLSYVMFSNYSLIIPGGEAHLKTKGDTAELSFKVKVIISDSLDFKFKQTRENYRESYRYAIFGTEDYFYRKENGKWKLVNYLATRPKKEKQKLVGKFKGKNSLIDMVLKEMKKISKGDSLFLCAIQNPAEVEKTAEYYVKINEDTEVKRIQIHLDLRKFYQGFVWTTEGELLLQKAGEVYIPLAGVVIAKLPKPLSWIIPEIKVYGVEKSIIKKKKNK